MAFVTQGVKATWANPGANDPAPANRQAGGWYFNPQTGSVDQWFPDTAGSTGGAGAPAQTAGSLAPATKGGGTDYFSQAMAALQPVSEAQIAPLKEQQTLVPKLFESAKQDIGSQQMAQLGQQRASAAAAGMTSTSGVEQSQEANIAQGWAKKLSMLPVQESQALMDVASKIATIQGGTIKEALGYASDLAKMASENAYREAEIALSQGRNDIAAARLKETEDYHNASLTLRGQTAGGGKPSYIDLQAQALAREIQSGQYKTVQEAMAAHPELSANTVFGIWTTNKGSTELPPGFGTQGANIVPSATVPSGGGFGDILKNIPALPGGGSLNQIGNILGGLKSLIPGQ